jgi:hypothetical protein
MPLSLFPPRGRQNAKTVKLVPNGQILHCSLVLCHYNRRGLGCCSHKGLRSSTGSAELRLTFDLHLGGHNMKRLAWVLCLMGLISLLATDTAEARRCRRSRARRGCCAAAQCVKPCKAACGSPAAARAIEPAPTPSEAEPASPSDAPSQAEPAAEPPPPEAPGSNPVPPAEDSTPPTDEPAAPGSDPAPPADDSATPANEAPSGEAESASPEGAQAPPSP